VTEAYELRQRNWALKDDADPEPVLPADPAPIIPVDPAPNDIPMVVNNVNPVLHNVPDAVNPQVANNQNHYVIRDTYLFYWNWNTIMYSIINCSRVLVQYKYKRAEMCV